MNSYNRNWNTSYKSLIVIMQSGSEDTLEERSGREDTLEERSEREDTLEERYAIKLF